MKLIVGLGNPGRQYAKTRHNLGFMVADKLVEMLGYKTHMHTSVEPDSEIAHDSAREALIAKPMTMMNLSGRAVGRLARYYKLEASDVWVIFDDIDLQFGQLRVRKGGSSSHNGVKSIIEDIGPNFGQIRFGVANYKLKNPIPADKFVLAKFDSTEASKVDEMVAMTAEIMTELVSQASLPDTTHNLLD